MKYNKTKWISYAGSESSSHLFHRAFASDPYFQNSPGWGGLPEITAYPTGYSIFVERFTFVLYLHG